MCSVQSLSRVQLFVTPVDFLDSDKNEDFVAVTHKYLMINKEDKIWKDRQLTLKEREHDYNDFLRQSFYYHTSTFMYRNIFRGNVPKVFKEPLMRGDNPRTHMHVFYTKGKVKFLDFVGSVYRYSENGIWSKTTTEAQYERNIKMFEFFVLYLVLIFQPFSLQNPYQNFCIVCYKKSPYLLLCNF